MTSGRKLSNTGKEDTFSMLQSVTPVPHSYTVHISLASTLGKHFYMRFQEPKRKFRPKIAELLAREYLFLIWGRRYYVR